MNNEFAVILSLIGLQSHQLQPELREALDAIAQRVRAISGIHDHLQSAPADKSVTYVGRFASFGLSPSTCEPNP